MGFFTILGLVLVGLLILSIIFIICVRTSNAHRFNKMFKIQKQKLNEYYDQINFEEKPAQETDKKIENEETDFKEKSEQLQSVQSEQLQQEVLPENKKYIDMLKRFEERRRFLQEQQEKEKQENEQKKQPEEIDDFEEFMNEHSYSRLFADKSLYEQIQNLSPELKAVIFSGLFKRIDD